jgi:hypothetical protein
MRDLKEPHTALHAPQERRTLVSTEVPSRLRPQNREDLVEAGALALKERIDERGRNIPGASTWSAYPESISERGMLWYSAVSGS